MLKFLKHMVRARKTQRVSERVHQKYRRAQPMFVGDKECQRDAREAVHCSASNRDTLTGRHNQ